MGRLREGRAGGWPDDTAVRRRCRASTKWCGGAGRRLQWRTPPLPRNNSMPRLPTLLAFLLTTLPLAAADKPVPTKDAAGKFTVPKGFQRHAVRRRAGHRPADRVHVRRPRPHVAGRVPELPAVAGRRQGQRPRRHPGGHRRRRRPRQEDGRHRQRRQPLGHRSRLRRRVALLHTELDFRPHQRRQAERPASGASGRLEPQRRQTQRLQRPGLGAGRLAVRLQRHPDEVPRRVPPARRRTSGPSSTAASGVTTRPGKSSTWSPWA